MKFQKYTTIAIIVMLIVNTICNVYMATEIRTINQRVDSIRYDTFDIENWLNHIYPAYQEP